MNQNKHTYIWKDIVEINGHTYAEEFPISGIMDGENIYQVDDFLEAVAQKYGVDVDDIKTYMLHDIDFDPVGLAFGAEDCGCYIDGTPEWWLRRKKGDPTSRLNALYEELEELISSREAQGQNFTTSQAYAIYADMITLQQSLRNAGYGNDRAPRVLVDVSGGVVEAVYSNLPELHVAVRQLDFSGTPNPSVAPPGMTKMY